MEEVKTDIETGRTRTDSMGEIEETVAQTEPMADQNNIDGMAAAAGVEIAPEEPLKMKEKLDARDKSR